MKRLVLLKKWLKNYLNKDDKLISIPSDRKLKMSAMLYRSSKIDDCVEYSEKEVNDAINKMGCFSDAALLRREMYNHRSINRTPDGKTYWKREVQPFREQRDLL